MIDAESANLRTRAIKLHIREKTKIQIRENYSAGWALLQGKIQDSPEYEIIVEQKRLMESFSDNPYWTVNKITFALGDLGYKIKFSCSSNPDNERWFVSWKGIDNDTN